MSTELVNDKDDAVAIRFFGGKDRGMLVNVLMPQSVAEMVGSMSVAEETKPDDKTTLSAWLEEQVRNGATIRYDREHRLGASSNRAKRAG